MLRWLAISALRITLASICALALAPLRLISRRHTAVVRKDMAESNDETETGALTAVAAIEYQMEMQAAKGVLDIEKYQPACNPMWNVVEILEQVLLHLPMRDLLLLQRVCYKWRELSKTSAPIRRALFLEPVNYGPISYIDWTFDDMSFYRDFWSQTHNPERDQPLRGPGKNDAPKRYKAHWGLTRTDIGAYRVYVNPLLAELFPVLSKSGVWSPASMSALALPLKAQARKASWRKMIITQPPISQLFIQCNVEPSMGWIMRPVVRFTGLRMGHLYTRLSEEARMLWIIGSDEWEEWNNADDLQKVVVGGGQRPGKTPSDTLSYLFRYP